VLGADSVFAAHAAVCVLINAVCSDSGGLFEFASRLPVPLADRTGLIVDTRFASLSVSHLRREVVRSWVAICSVGNREVYRRLLL